MLSEFVFANTRIAQVVWQRIPHRRANHRVHQCSLQQMKPIFVVLLLL